MVEAKEDLSCPLVIQSITEVADWESRFQQFGYTEEQTRLVRQALSKMEEWIAVNQCTDWKRGTDKKGLTVDGRTSERGLSMMRCSKKFEFTPEEIFLTLCDGALRQDYDPNIEITKNLQKIAANTYACYQKAKRIMMVISPRDFVIVTYFHQVTPTTNIISCNSL